MTGTRLTRERIDELLRFLPRLAAPGRSFVERWAGGERAPDGTQSSPYPVYAGDVLEFFGLAAQPWWLDEGYDPAVAAERLADDRFVERATLAEIRSLLTYCVRGERFGAGHWEAVLRAGRVVTLLRRLAVLREALDPPGS